MHSTDFKVGECNICVLMTTFLLLAAEYIEQKLIAKKILAL